MEEKILYDVLIVGAGPSGLAAAIKLHQLAALDQKTLKICILEKGAQVGAHIISGAILDPRSLKELLPERWQEAPLDTAVKKEAFYYLSKAHSFRLPTPRSLQNKGNFIISLGALCRFLAAEAERFGTEIYPGFAASKILYDAQGAVAGVETGPMGINKNGEKTANFQPGMALYAKQTFFAEGCRGQLSQELIHHFDLAKDRCPQTYGLGLKEIWSIPAKQHAQGTVLHTIGWPLDRLTYGGGFLYHFSENRVSLGFALGLDYKNPWLNPFKEFQRFKTHPFIRNILQGGERLAYGARAINEGGWQALPKLNFPGGVLIGDAAGFLNVAKIKGIHPAIKSGILAAEAAYEALSVSANPSPLNLHQYPAKFEQSWLKKELFAVRNIRPGFHHGRWFGLANAFFETYLSYGHSPWTLKHQVDHLSLLPATAAKKIDYPKPDGKLTFDKASSVYLANVYHEDNQPAHLVLKNPALAIEVNYKNYASPETRYCPADVYEIVNHQDEPALQINAQNCIHCKTCDIKDPTQNIIWKAPEGGGGPNYENM